MEIDDKKMKSWDKIQKYFIWGTILTLGYCFADIVISAFQCIGEPLKGEHTLEGAIYVVIVLVAFYVNGIMHGRYINKKREKRIKEMFDFLDKMHVAQAKQREERFTPRRIRLDEDNFKTLVTGGELDLGHTKMILEDIGYLNMIDILEKEYDKMNKGK